MKLTVKAKLRRYNTEYSRALWVTLVFKEKKKWMGIKWTINSKEVNSAIWVCSYFDNLNYKEHRKLVKELLMDEKRLRREIEKLIDEQMEFIDQQKDVALEEIQNLIKQKKKWVWERELETDKKFSELNFK